MSQNPQMQRIAESKKDELLDTDVKGKMFSYTSQKVFKGKSAIHGLAHWVPETKVTSLEIQDSITAFQGDVLEIERRTGMIEKRVHEGEESILELALFAVDELKKSGTLYGTELPINEIDLIIYFGISREFSEPATAIAVQKVLGLNGPMAFDVSDACLGFTDALCIADSMIESKRIRYALLVSAEKLSIMGDRAVENINEGGNVLEQFASLTLADGSVAVLVGPQTEHAGIINLRAGLRETHSEYNDLCVIKDFSSRMVSFPKEMFAVVLEIIPGLLDTLLDAIGWDKEDIYKVITHQASKSIVVKGSVVTGIPLHKGVLTFPEYGNIASVSLPLSMSMLIAEEKNIESKRFITFGVGSGLGFGVFAFEVS